MAATLTSTITCPACGTRAAEQMPTDACVYFYECNACQTLLQPAAGDCCVFCSYGDVKCPPIQCSGRRTAVTVRPATPADAADLSALAARTFREAFAADNTAEDIEQHCARHFQPELQRAEISDPKLITLLAEVAGELLGFAQLRLGHGADCVRGEQPAELNRIYVAREWQGRGVAHELMRAVLAAATCAASDCVWLGVWEHNPRAIAFYGKYGFRAVGEHSFMLGRERQRDLILVVEMDQRMPVGPRAGDASGPNP